MNEEESQEIPVFTEENEPGVTIEENEHEDIEEVQADLMSPTQNTAEDDLNTQLCKEQEKSAMLEDKLTRMIADFQNLEKKTYAQIQAGIMAKAGEIFIDLIEIRDDFERARDSFAESEKDTAGLNSILKNMDSILSKHGVQPMDIMGDIFDPNMHEAISVTEDAVLDENTITKIIRKGYILHDKTVRTSLVEISKKPVVD